ncbi:MAG: 3-hydroxyacyl-CoA dehydrogenase family protein [Myxococcota bacterium]
MSIETIVVVGCGQMGLGIAEACASHGKTVRLIKATPGTTEKAEARVQKSLGKRLQKGKIDQAEHDAILGRISFHTDLVVEDVDLVIESALEHMETKVSLLRRLEARMAPGAILASNTSSLPLLELAEAMERPAQFLALHFFNPAQVMKLVEVGVTESTAPGVIETCKQLCAAIEKTPVIVSASPGYVVNRLLTPYMLHAIETLDAGIADAPSVDTAMKLGCGHPMGPLALADLIGLDVVRKMAETMGAELRDSRYRIPPLLDRLVEAGQLGRKSKLGLYDYRDDPRNPVMNPALAPVPQAAE